jgi:hypothetical protein
VDAKGLIADDAQVVLMSHQVGIGPGPDAMRLGPGRVEPCLHRMPVLSI